MFNNARESGLGAIGNKSLLSNCKYMVMKLPLSSGQRRTAAACKKEVKLLFIVLQ